MDYSTEQEFRKLWRALKCKANCGSVCNCPSIEVTKAGFLALINSNTLESSRLYKITDVEEGLYLNTTGVNTYDTQGTLLMYVPDYTIENEYKGQLFSTFTPAAGEKYIWGNLVWESVTGTNPAPISNYELDPAAWTLLPKSVANHYILMTFIAEYDAVNQLLTFLKQPAEQNENSTSSNGQLIFNFNSNAQWTNSSIPKYLSNTGWHLNNYVDDTSIFAFNKVTGGNLGIYSNLFAVDSNCTSNEIIGGEITGNYVVEGNIGNNVVKSTCKINNNTINEGSIRFMDMNDDCQITDNTLTDGIFWDFFLGESARISGNTLSGGGCYIIDVDTMKLDEIKDNVLSGSDVGIESLHMFANCSFNNNTIATPSFKFNRTEMFNSHITGFNYTNGGGATEFSNNYLKNSTLSGASDINIIDCNFINVTLPLTGFTTDIVGETIQDGKGWFTFTHNFTTNPLLSGSVIKYNILPQGCRLTRVITIVSVASPLTGGAGAEMFAGMETNDANYAFAATAIGSIANAVVNTVGSEATAHRTFQIGASVNNITGGTISFQVEFILV